MESFKQRLLTVFAGFPSPGESWAEPPLDPQTLLALHPDATYYVKVRGMSMRDAGIRDGDLLVVDRAIPPEQSSIIVATLNGAFVVKQIVFIRERVILKSAHPNYPAFTVRPHMGYSFFGVVTFVIHPLHPLAMARLHEQRSHET